MLPVCPGVKVTWIAQEALAFTVAFEQLSVSLKPELAVMDVIAKAIAPVFVSVTV